MRTRRILERMECGREDSREGGMRTRRILERMECGREGF